MPFLRRENVRHATYFLRLDAAGLGRGRARRKRYDVGYEKKHVAVPCLGLRSFGLCVRCTRHAV